MNRTIGLISTNYSVPGLRMGLSAYYGHSFNNTLQADQGKYKDTKGAVSIAAFDFDYKGHNWIARGNIDYGHLGDAATISKYNREQSSTSPYKRTHVGKNAVAGGIEAGYNVFSQIRKLRESGDKLYVFGRYEYYDSYAYFFDCYVEIIRRGICRKLYFCFRNHFNNSINICVYYCLFCWKENIGY